MSDYINIKDDRFWQILFDEACVEGKQAERIQKELEQIAVDEREIIRKPFERVVERLEERKDHIMKEFVLTDKAKEVKSDSLNRINELDGTIEIVKEECGISE